MFICPVVKLILFMLQNIFMVPHLNINRIAILSKTNINLSTKILSHHTVSYHRAFVFCCPSLKPRAKCGRTDFKSDQDAFNFAQRKAYFIVQVHVVHT